MHDRHDLLLGIVCSGNRDYRNQYGYDGEIYQQRQDDDDDALVAIISGYVDFMRVQTGASSTFLPLVHVSRIHTPIPSPRIIPLVLTLAYEHWVCNEMWKTQFNEIGDKLPNVGALFRDRNTGGVCFVNNTVERDQLLQNVLRPILVVDFVNGRDHIPGLEKLACPSTYPELINNFNHFFNNEVINPNFIPAHPMYREYVGTVQQGSQPVDSRCIDYLNMVVRYPTEPEKCCKLTSVVNDPRIQLNVVRDFDPTITIAYDNTVIRISPDLYNIASSYMHRNLSMANTVAGTNTINFAGFVVPPNTQYNTVSAFGQPGYGNTMQGMPVYGWQGVGQSGVFQ